MAFLADTWILWLVLAALVGGVMVVFRDSRQQNASRAAPPSSQDFSIRNILFGIYTGEGDLFLGYLFATIFFSMSLAGLLRWVRNLF